MTTSCARTSRLAGLLGLALGVLADAPEAAPPLLAATTSEDADAGVDTTSRTSTIVPLPLYFYTPETESGFGALLAYYFRPEGTPEDRSSSVQAIFIYTTKKQLSVILEGSMYLRSGKARVRAAIGGSEFPDTFWGVGNDTPDAFEEDFTPRTVFGSAAYERRLGSAWYMGPLVQVAHRELIEREEGGLLDTHIIPGTRDGYVVLAGASVTRDTRNDDVYPRSGMLSVAQAGVADGALGSDYAFTSYSLSSTVYVAPARTHVLALRVSADATTATPPFDLLPGLGGDTLLRGYYAGRYRDRNLVAVQAEYRLPVWWRLGLVVFGAAGQVAHDVDAFRADRFHGSGGFGLRFLVNRAEGLNIRADFGSGETGDGFYLGIGEVF